jgi:hypothetical protein
LRPTTLVPDAISRDLFAVLADSDTMTVAAATAEIAAGWSMRRRQRRHSPSSVHAAEAIVVQVGADLIGELTRQPSADVSGRSSHRLSSRRVHRSLQLPVGSAGELLCLPCGRLAAVGWASVVPSGAPVENRPVEFDCRAGCQVDLDELARDYGSRPRRARPGGDG